MPQFLLQNRLFHHRVELIFSSSSEQHKTPKWTLKNSVNKVGGGGSSGGEVLVKNWE